MANGNGLEHALRADVAELSFVRLNPDERGHFALYGEFEDRCAAFLGKYGTNVAARPYRQELRQRFVQAPQLSAYLLAREGRTTVGHVCAWLAQLYGEPLIHVDQAEADEPGAIGNLVKPFAAFFAQWSDEMNLLYQKSANPQTRVTSAEFVTWHDVEKWKALLSGIAKVEKVRSIIRMSF